MRIMLSLCTILATTSMAEAQLGPVTGTVQQTTDLQRDELSLPADEGLRTNVRQGSRLDQMRQQRALRDARRAARTAREATEQGNTVPRAGTDATGTAALEATDLAQAKAQTGSAATANPARAESSVSAAGQTQAARIAGAATTNQASLAAEAPAVPAGTGAVVHQAATETRLAAPSIQVESPRAVVVSPAPHRVHSAPASRSETIIVHDHASAAASSQTRDAGISPAPRGLSPARPTAINWIDGPSMRRHAFPLGCALLLILSLLLASRLLTTSRRNSA